MMKAMILIFVFAACSSGCGFVYYEPNPPIYYDVACEIDTGDSHERFETISGTISCSPPIDPSECNGTYHPSDAGYAEIPDGQLCKCRGVYKLNAERFSIEVDGLSVEQAGILSTSNGRVKRATYKGITGTAELDVTIRGWKDFNSDYHNHGGYHEYDLIFAGGFTADFGSTKIKGGYFFAIDPTGKSQ